MLTRALACRGETSYAEAVPTCCKGDGISTQGHWVKSGGRVNTECTDLQAETLVQLTLNLSDDVLGSSITKDDGRYLKFG